MIKKAIALVLLIVAVYWSFSAIIPSKISDLNTDKNEFSTERALIHLKEITKAPHYVGSDEHKNVRNYIVNELENLGLDVEIQESFSMREWGNLSKPKNIIAKIKGSDNTKALILLSHYDSAPQASLGASDAGSGVVTILESLRAYLNSGKQPKNDIIIVITDAEELGLNGADIFVNKHRWAKDVGLVLNFEARGSGGSAVMWPETNGGNAKLVDEFVQANPSYPVAYSLIYSIYKLLPNDTDATRFREDGDIESFNFAFIDDHYDYHTANDTYERLDRNTLEHQGSYLMPLLNHFSNADLSNLKSTEDKIYFNVPLFKTIAYNYALIWPMFILAITLFIVFVFYGFKTSRLIKEEVIKGFIPLFLSIISCLIVGYILWWIIKFLNPQYYEMLHKFTYNGYTYIAAFSLIAIGICASVYNKYYKENNTASLLVAPIFIWLIICALVGQYLEGASFFIIPVYFALISLFVLIKQQKPSLLLMAILCFPLLFIFSPFIKLFPVALGFFMKIGAVSITVKLVSMLLIALIFGLMISVFGFFKHKKRWSYVLFFIAFCFLISAQFQSGFNEERPKPNSLVYVLNADTNTANWATYDKKLDAWTKNFIDDEANSSNEGNTFSSKYNSGFTYTKKAEAKQIPQSKITIYKDTIIDDLRHIRLSVVQQRRINRFDLYANKDVKFKDFEANGIEVPKGNPEGFAFENRRSTRLFSYFVSDNDSLNLNFTVPKDQKTQFKIYEASFDLLSNEIFTVPERTKEMIPKPFILNDAVIVTKTIDIN